MRNLRAALALALSYEDFDRDDRQIHVMLGCHLRMLQE
jgi:hypothetical protein